MISNIRGMVADIFRQLDRALPLTDDRDRKTTPRSAMQALRSIDTAGWPFAAVWFLEWLLHLLGPQNLRVSSAIRYKTAIGQSFIAETVDIDFHGLDGEDFIALYESLFRRWQTTGNTAYRAARLEQLHLFGVQRFNLAPLPYSLAGGDMATRVHARLVPERVFRSCRNMVCERIGKDDDFREALWVYLTLMFRCGLRKNELIKLLCRDISFGDDVWLFLRDNRFGDNKSRDFKCPASVLVLPGEERTRVVDFLRFYQALTPASPDNPVFHRSGLFADIWDGGEISGAINHVLQELAPGQSLNQHCFRHTALNNILLASTGLDSLIAEFTAYTPAHCAEICEAVFKATATGQHDLWCLAALAGHGHPAVTVRSYIHLLPLILAEKLSTSDLKLSRNVIHNLADVSQTQAGHWFSRYGRTD